MLNARPVKTIVSFLLIFALSLFASGCGSANQKEVIGKSLPQTADKETAEKTDEEIPDKFVMLKEVYDILSSSLGEPYRTPEYWGGEEIDMMKAGDNYLIGLRNIQNQMHYLLYERETDSIIEIDTQGKRILWEEIYYSKEINTISFPFYELDTNFSSFSPHIITYYCHSDTTSVSPLKNSDLFSVPQDILWDIPNSKLQHPLTNDFSFLLDLYTALKMQNNFEYIYGTNISILNRTDDILFHALGNWELYENFIYEKSLAQIFPFSRHKTEPQMIHWESFRFQKDPNKVCFPYLGKRNFERQEFPSLLFYDKKSNRYSVQPVSLWHTDNNYTFSYGLDLDLPFSISEIIVNQDRLLIRFVLEDNRILDESFPLFTVTSCIDGTVSLLFDHCLLSESLSPISFPLFLPGLQINNLTTQTIQRSTPDFYGQSESCAIELSLQMKENYLLFGKMNQYFTVDKKSNVDVGVVAEVELWWEYQK